MRYSLFSLILFDFDNGLFHDIETDDVDGQAEEGSEAAAQEGRSVGGGQSIEAINDGHTG